MTFQPKLDTLSGQFLSTFIHSHGGLQASDMADADRCSGLQLSLAGTFALRTADGRPVEINGKYLRRLLAILARSPIKSRSREQIIDLLWDDCKDPLGSLRQLRHKVSVLIGPHGASIAARDNVITLTGITEVTSRSSETSIEFFEDAGFGTETFEDWLRAERMAFESAPVQLATRLGQDRPRPRVGLTVAASGAIDTQCAVITHSVANCLRDIFLSSDFVALSDIRQTPRKASELDAVVEVRVTEMGEAIEISLAALTAESARCLFSNSLRTRTDGGFSPMKRDVAQFLTSAAAAIERASVQAARVDLSHWNQAPLYEIVTRMFRMTTADVAAATDALDNFTSDRNQASTLAWRAFGKMLLNGEKLVAHGEAAVEEAGTLIAWALDADPMNPTALAVAAHFASFVERDFTRAAELSDASLSIAPHSPFARDVRAMLELYAGRTKTGARQARLAGEMSQTGPLRHYVGGSLIIAASLTGDHAFAVARGREILRARPSFLPVMRHMFASLAILGDHDAAQRMLSDVQRIDPIFGTPEMASRNDGLPSQQSRDLVAHAMQLLLRPRIGVKK